MPDALSQPDEIVTWQLTAGTDGHFNVLRQTTPTDVRVEARTLVSDISFHYFNGSGIELAAASGLSVSDASAATRVTADLRYNALAGAGADRVTTFTERLRNVR